MGSQEIYFRSVDQQNDDNNNNNPKNIDHQAKETYNIMSTKVKYEIDHISLFCIIQQFQVEFNFCFLYIYFIVIYKQTIILEEI